MSILSPGLLADKDPFNVTSIRNTWAHRALRKIFSREVQRVLDESKEGIPDATREKLLENVRSIPCEDPAIAITEDKIADLERTGEILQRGIVEVGSLVPTSDINLKRDIEQAAIEDKAEIDRLFKHIRRERLKLTAFEIQLRNMDVPHADPLLIQGQYGKVLEIMYYLVAIIVSQNPKDRFVPDIYQRQENEHSWNGKESKGLHWKYLPGRSNIDNSVTALDFVNIDKRGEYMIATVEEDDEQIPVPIDIPRHNNGGSEVSLRKHLADLWKSRTVKAARWINESLGGCPLGCIFDHSNFTPRENELFLECSKVPELQIADKSTYQALLRNHNPKLSIDTSMLFPLTFLVGIGFLFVHSVRR